MTNNDTSNVLPNALKILTTRSCFDASRTSTLDDESWKSPNMNLTVLIR